MANFTYVLIPADETVSFKELSATAVSCGDTLSELLKKSFAGGSVTNLDGLRAEYGDKIDEKVDAFQAVADQGTVEVMPLVRQSKTTLPQPNLATFFYYDEMGALKDRPPNRRASELAKTCGVDLEHPLPGDVYIGRVVCDPQLCSVSILANELDSSSPWIKQAPVENAQWKDALHDFGSAAKAKQVGGKEEVEKNAEEEEAENVSRGWRWTQTEADLEMTISIPEGTTAKGLGVTIARTSLRVVLKTDAAKPLLELKLYAPVRPDESTWVLGKDAKGAHLQVTLEKEAEQTWKMIESKAK